MPPVSQKQQAWAGIQYSKKKAGQKTETNMSLAQLKEFASAPRNSLPYSAKKEK